VDKIGAEYVKVTYNHLSTCKGMAGGDEIGLMPSSWDGWLEIHKGVCSTLRRYKIDFIELPGDMKT
jgi:hypothetical protein